MSDEPQTPEPVIPEDYLAYERWRETGELPAESKPESSAAPDEAEKAEPEAKTAEESEPSQPEQETKEGDEDEKPQPKGGFQRRIDRLTREKYELQAQLEAAQRQLAAKPAAPAEAPKPAPNGKPKLEDYDTHEEFVEALTDWKIAQKTQEFSERAAREKAQAEQQAKQQTWLERKAEAAKRIPDLEEVLDQELPLTPAMRDTILESEKGPDLAYWLGTHPTECARIAKLSPLAAARELGRVEASFEKPPAPESKKVTNAPKPIKPVAGAKSAAPPNVYDEATAADYPAWERARLAQLKRS